jgi:hypothetical protein
MKTVLVIAFHYMLKIHCEADWKGVGYAIRAKTEAGYAA